MGNVEWQPIETAPKDGKEVILFAAPRHYGIGFFTECPREMVGGPLFWDWDWGHQPTHWLPLPPPPIVHGE